MSLQDEIQEAKKRLDQGEVIGLPTETVYGLAARIDLPLAIKKIFLTKERPFFDPLIVHVASIEQAKGVASSWGQVAQALAEKFWPGPLTLILPRREDLNPMITSGLDSVGLRMPSHPLALSLLKAVGVPLAAPSANKFGRTSPTSAEHVRTEFQKEDIFVLDGGPCQIGIESTVLKVEEDEKEAWLSILRKGFVLKSDLESTLNDKKLKFEFVEDADKKASPGHLKHHYMPDVPLVVCRHHNISEKELLLKVNSQLQQMPDEIESIKIIKPKDGVKNYQVLTLSPDPVLATRELYSRLREAAAQGKDCIVFYREAHQDSERWESLFDRLDKAASLIL